MKKICGILICIILLLHLTGCQAEKDVENTSQVEKELFMLGHTLDDGRVIHLAFDVPYGDFGLSLALLENEITVDDFINELEFVDVLKDGGSKIYRYNKIEKTFGSDDFYVIVCNSLDNSKDIYVTRYKESLNDKCHIKMDDLNGVSMTIKEGSLTRFGATVIITDLSGKDNIYGQPYRLDKKENGKWLPLTPIISDYAWNSIGYSVGEDNTLEFTINWEVLYGKLESGEYRIVKDTSEPGEEPTHYITVEFIL